MFFFLIYYLFIISFFFVVVVGLFFFLWIFIHFQPTKPIGGDIIEMKKESNSFFG